MLKRVRSVHDISVMLGQESIDYPGDPPYRNASISQLENGDSCELSKLSLSAHSGTHIDAPAHFIKNGNTIDRYHPQDFILPAHVVDVDAKPAVTADDVAGIAFQPGEALLFRTENSTSGRCRSGVFSEDYVYLTAQAAEACATRKAALVGLDYITIEEFGSDVFHAHKTLLAAGVFILEGIDLTHVPCGRYTLVCLPLKLKGVEASPVRAILMEGEI